MSQHDPGPTYLRYHAMPILDTSKHLWASELELVLVAYGYTLRCWETMKL